jgi:predicted HicB family RNase H-like nuclease
MTEPKPLASLNPTLLARKGGAKPAMRSPLASMTHFDGAAARQFADDDLGWNDHGEDYEHEREVAEVVQFAPEGPEVVRQQQAVARHLARPSRPRRKALDEGRRAAFTLRVDAERHLKLRLACTLDNRSAQQLVTEALDRFLDELPDVAALAAQVGKNRRTGQD